MEDRFTGDEQKTVPRYRAHCVPGESLKDALGLLGAAGEVGIPTSFNALEMGDTPMRSADATAISRRGFFGEGTAHRRWFASSGSTRSSPGWRRGS